MSLFIDTSAFLAIIDADQAGHREVARVWHRQLDSERTLFTSNFVLVETFALVQRGLRIGAMRDVANVLVPFLQRFGWTKGSMPQRSRRSSALGAAGFRWWIVRVSNSCAVAV